MNINNLLVMAGLVALGGCSTAYQTAQTPDDLYYTPPTEQIAYANGSGNRGEYLSVPSGRDKYTPNEDLENYRNDRWLRMSIGSPYRMSLYNSFYWDDWGYGGFGGFGSSPFSLRMGFGYGAGYGFMNPWYSPFAGPVFWNSFYNPYAFNYNPHFYPSYYGYGGYGGYYGGIVPGVKAPIYTTPPLRANVFNRNAYKTTSSSSRTYYNPRTGTYSNYNNTNSADSRAQRRTTNASTNTYYDTRQQSDYRSYTPPQSRSERTYTPAPNPSSGRSSGNTGSGGGGVRRPTRN
jgi:hypothetical protein